MKNVLISQAFGSWAITALMATIVHAKNVDLVTLPNRDTVQLTIYNSEDLTLVKETRFVTLKKGSNKLQFSWAGTLIDPSSVEMRPLANADSIDVLDTVYPGQKPQHLIWTVQSDLEGQVPIEVSYFTSGLTWRMDYVAIASSDEATLSLVGHVRVFNNSGEEYDDAEIRLIVGKINLVQKIAELARQSGEATEESTPVLKTELKRRASRQFFSLAEVAEKVTNEKKKIVKEGLSEYFMFSVGGTESIRNGWSKRMAAVEGDQIPFDIVYRMRSFQYGPRPVRFFVWNNDEKHELGDSPLPNGVVRVFRANGDEGLSLLGIQTLNYVPIQAPIEVNLGTDDLVVHEKRNNGASRSDFSFHKLNKNVIGWNETQRWIDTVRNYRGKPIRFELRTRIGGDVEMTYEKPTHSFDFNTVQTDLTVPASGLATYPYKLVIRHGANTKQNRVRLIAPQ